MSLRLTTTMTKHSIGQINRFPAPFPDTGTKPFLRISAFDVHVGYVSASSSYIALLILLPLTVQLMFYDPILAIDVFWFGSFIDVDVDSAI